MNNVNDLSSNGWVLPAEMLRGLLLYFHYWLFKSFHVSCLFQMKLEQKVKCLSQSVSPYDKPFIIKLARYTVLQSTSDTNLWLKFRRPYQTEYQFVLSQRPEKTSTI